MVDGEAVCPCVLHRMGSAAYFSASPAMALITCTAPPGPFPHYRCLFIITPNPGCMCSLQVTAKWFSDIPSAEATVACIGWVLTGGVLAAVVRQAGQSWRKQHTLSMAGSRCAERASCRMRACARLLMSSEVQAKWVNSSTCAWQTSVHAAAAFVTMLNLSLSLPLSVQQTNPLQVLQSVKLCI